MVAKTVIGNTIEIPFDVVEGILMRVPVKDLVRFRCVCKRWRSLFRDTEFIKKHMSYAPISRKLLSIEIHLPEGDAQSRPRSIFYEHDSDGKRRMILEADYAGSPLHSNGLICLWLDQNTLAVWNPSLREITKIPTSMMHSSQFDMFGFGYDDSTNDYKIVLLRPTSVPTEPPEETRQVEIFSLQSGSRIIDFPPYPVQYCIDLAGNLLGQHIFWHAAYDEAFLSEPILSFDIVSETFNYFQGPPHIFPVEPGGLVVLRGRLCVVEMQRPEFMDDKIVVWCGHQGEYKSRVESWSKLFELRTDRWEFDYRFLGCESETKDGEILVRIMNGKSIGARVVAYNFETKTFRKLETNFSFRNCFGGPYEFLQNLVSPYGLLTSNIENQLCISTNSASISSAR